MYIKEEGPISSSRGPGLAATKRWLDFEPLKQLQMSPGLVGSGMVPGLTEGFCSRLYHYAMCSPY